MRFIAMAVKQCARLPFRVAPFFGTPLFFCMFSPPAHAQVDPDLTGLGVFDHNLPRQTIARIAPLLRGVGTRFILTLGKAGKPEHCTYAPASDGLSPEEGSQLCGELIRYGSWKTPEWYASYMEGGYITFALRDTGFRAIRRPVRLAPAGQGVNVELFRDYDECEAYEPFLNRSDVETLCKLAIASGEVFEKNDAGAMVATLWVAADRPDEVIDVMAEPWVRDIDMPVRFSTIPPSPSETIWPEQGTLLSNFSQLDYPREALINEMEGAARVLVGFDRSGEPKTCRPLVSDNSSYLGNATCPAAMRRVRISFSADAPLFEGVRYRPVRVNWVMPE